MRQPALFDEGPPAQPPTTTLADRIAAARAANNAALAREEGSEAVPPPPVVDLVVVRRGPRGDVELVNAAGDTQRIAGADWCPSIRRRSLGFACRLLGASAGVYEDPHGLTHGWAPIDPAVAARQRARVRTCSCGAPMVFMATARGQMPVDVATAEPEDTEFRPGRHRSHFATCPDAAAHRGRAAT